MDNTLSKTQGPATLYTGEYLAKLLNGPHNASAMDTELRKINAHVLQEETNMVRLLAFFGITCILLAMACLFYLPGVH